MEAASRSRDALRARLAEIVGDANVLSGERLATYSADGEQPLAAVFPATEAEVAEVARLAGLERLPVVVWGGGTKQDVEPVQPRDGIVLGMCRQSATVDLDAANLTVTVGAGKVVDDLQRELAGVGLFLPLDPVDSARSTVGGTLAANCSGPRRLLYRTCRDWVLGLREVTPAGKRLRTGGKAVKDVAGYDLKKLYIGSWGTLGAITEATFRLLPLPEASATVVAVFPLLSSACAAVSGLLASRLRPSAAELLSHGVLADPAVQALQMRPGEYLLLVQAEGAREAVARQRRDLLDLATRCGAREAISLESEEEQRLWVNRRSVFSERPPDRPCMVMKGSILLKRLFDLAAGLVALGTRQGLDVSFASHAGNGIVYTRIVAGDGQGEALVGAAEQVARLAADCGGFAMVQRIPREVAGRVPLWPPRSDYGLMRGIKAALDLHGLWSPARTPGGGRDGGDSRGT